MKVIGNADKQETGRWLNNRAENFKPMWQLLGSGYTGLPDERLDASSLGYRNAKKKDSNPLPGVARRERPIADLGATRRERQLRAQSVIGILAARARSKENAAIAKSSVPPRGGKTGHSCKAQQDKSVELTDCGLCGH